MNRTTSIAIASLILFCGSTGIWAQTINGKAVRDYSRCLDLSGTTFKESCLGNGVNNNQQRSANSYVTNRCDQEVEIVYSFDGSWIDRNGNPAKERQNTEYLKPGERQRLYFCKTRNNSGSIYIKSVKPYGVGSSSGASSSSGGSGGSGGFGNGGFGGSSGSTGTSGGYGSGSSSGGAYGSQGNSTGKTGSSQSSDRPSFNSKEEYERYRDQQQNASGGKDQQSALDKEREHEEFHREHVRKNNESAAARQRAREEEKADRQEQKAQREAERQRREQQKYEQKQREWEQKQARQQRQQEYYRQQTRQNTQKAAELGAAALLLHYAVGTLIYSGMGNEAYENTHKGNAPHMQLKLGYGGSYLPVRILNEDAHTVTIDLTAGMEYDFVYGENYGLGLSTQVMAGHLIEQFRFDYEFGAKAFAGLENIKLYSSYSVGKRHLWHNGWIDASTTDESEKEWRYGRFAIGPRLSWNDNREHLDLLFNRDYQQGDEEAYHAYRIEYWKHHRVRVFGEYGELPMGGDPLPYFSLGVHRTWDMFKDGPTRHSFGSMRQQLYSKNKWVISFLNPVLSWGELSNEDVALSSERPNLAINLITVEKEVDVTEDFSLSLGAGFTSLRGITGSMEYLSGEPFMPDVEGMTYPGHLHTFSMAEIDLPVGAQYYLYSSGISRYWTAVKFQPSLNLGMYRGKVLEPEEISGIASGSNFNYKFGMGVDLPYSPKSDFRLGCYYTLTTGFGADAYQSSMNGLHFQFAMLY